jgi:hypothetical protein
MAHLAWLDGGPFHRAVPEPSKGPATAGSGANESFGIRWLSEELLSLIGAGAAPDPESLALDEEVDTGVLPAGGVSDPCRPVDEVGALGVTKAKRRIAKATGIPTTRQGRRAKLGRLFGIK